MTYLTIDSEYLRNSAIGCFEQLERFLIQVITYMQFIFTYKRTLSLTLSLTDDDDMMMMMMMMIMNCF